MTTVVLGDYAHTARVRRQATLGGEAVEFPAISPVNRAFADMARSQRYDACELAIGAFLQAHEAGKPLRLLPVVVMGSFHHGSIVASPAKPPDGPGDLTGRRVAVRSYSQTTGLWVRGFLEEDYGVTPADVTWVVTERSHVAEYEDPPNVELTERSLEDELTSGDAAAAILGPKAGERFPTLIEDPQAAARKWYESHGIVPVNHFVSVTEELAAGQPGLVSDLYEALVAGIDDTAGEREAAAAGGLPSGVAYGLERIAPAVELAIRYAERQRLISRAPDLSSLFLNV